MTAVTISDGTRTVTLDPSSIKTQWKDAIYIRPRGKSETKLDADGIETYLFTRGKKICVYKIDTRTRLSASEKRDLEYMYLHSAILTLTYDNCDYGFPVSAGVYTDGSTTGYMRGLTLTEVGGRPNLFGASLDFVAGKKRGT